MRYNKSIRGKLYSYFTIKLNLKPSTHGYLRGDCPYCGGRFCFGVNVEKLRVNCFKDKCQGNYGSENLIKLICYLEGFETYNEAFEFLRVQQEYEAYIPKVIVPKVETNPIELPKGFNLISLGDSRMGQAARNYMVKRGFDITDLTLRGVGYCLEGEYAGYIIFPFYRAGKLEFFQGRIFAGSGPKMRNPPEQSFGIGKTQIIYNQDALYIYNRIYLVESVTNSLTLGERAIATLGKSVSNYQLSHLISSPCREIIILLDPDAIQEAIQLALNLCNYKKVKLVTWEGSGDVNDLGKKRIMGYSKNTPFQRYAQLFKMKQQYK